MKSTQTDAPDNRKKHTKSTQKTHKEEGEYGKGETEISRRNRPARRRD